MTETLEYQRPKTALDARLPRRLPSVAFAACAFAMPLLTYVIPIFAGEVLCGGTPSRPAQYWMFAVTFASQFVLYASGIACLRFLRMRCSRPPSTFGVWVTRVAGTAFLVVGGLWCGLCAFLWFVMTFMPW